MSINTLMNFSKTTNSHQIFPVLFQKHKYNKINKYFYLDEVFGTWPHSQITTLVEYKWYKIFCGKSILYLSACIYRYMYAVRFPGIVNGFKGFWELCFRKKIIVIINAFRYHWTLKKRKYNATGIFMESKKKKRKNFLVKLCNPLGCAPGVGTSVKISSDVKKILYIIQYTCK